VTIVEDQLYRLRFQPGQPLHPSGIGIGIGIGDVIGLKTPLVLVLVLETSLV